MRGFLIVGLALLAGGLIAEPVSHSPHPLPFGQVPSRGRFIL